MHKLVFYSTIVGVPACVNDAPSWTVLLWFTTDFRLYRHIVPRLIPFSSSTAIHSLALSLFPLPLSLLFLFFRIQKKFPFLKKKRITPTCVSTGKIFHQLGRRQSYRVVWGCWAGQWWTYERYDVLLSSSLARVFVLLRAPRAIELMGRAAAL